jgi:CHASE3 domain sensor protein
MKLLQHSNKILFWLGLSLPMLALVVIGWIVHQTGGQFKNSFSQVAHTYKVLNLVQQTQLHLLDAETERRGYLLTASDEYLDAYGKAMTAMRNDIEGLQNLAHDSTDQQTNISELQSLVTDRLRIDPNMLSGGKTNLHDALAIALTDQGKNTMNEIGHVLFSMGQAEEYLLDSSQQRAETDTISSQLTSVVLIGTVALALIFIVFIVLRLEKLQKVVTVCAWTGQVKFEGQWIRLDEYLQRRFGLFVSHGLSKEAAAKMIQEVQGLKKPDPDPPPGPTRAD